MLITCANHYLCTQHLNATENSGGGLSDAKVVWCFAQEIRGVTELGLGLYYNSLSPYRVVVHTRLINMF